MTINSTSPSQSRSRSKGLFLFSLLILGYIGFQYGLGDGNRESDGKTSFTSDTVTVEINGAVLRPGLMTYSHRPSVREVISDSGGLSQTGQLSAWQGQEIFNQDQTLTIQKETDGIMGLYQSPLSPRALWILGRSLPINRASVEDLGRLPGIGPKLAERIIAYREARGGFASLEQLMEVKGIKEKTFSKIKDYFIL